MTGTGARGNPVLITPDTVPAGCFWFTAPDGALCLAPGCMAQIQDPDAQCLCNTLTARLDLLAEKLRDLEERQRYTNVWWHAWAPSYATTPTGGPSSPRPAPAPAADSAKDSWTPPQHNARDRRRTGGPELPPPVEETREGRLSMNSAMRLPGRIGPHALLIITAAVSLTGWAVRAVALHKRLVATKRDPLTGLLRRDAFTARARRLLARHGDDVTLVMVDADHLTAVNDTLSHAAGDAVLAEFGARLTA
ncbi:diguanylate cyclase [Streptomyces microflavus]|uniref:diguanylate cyclase n=1 Tax=Streptomyces microflavus TaxID=1919 RepID=UPI0033184553